jgi:hypothetical protein
LPRTTRPARRSPDDLFNRPYARARGFGKALESSAACLCDALIRECLYTRAPGFDTTAVFEEVQAANDPFTVVKLAHFQSSFTPHRLRRRLPQLPVCLVARRSRASAKRGCSTWRSPRRGAIRSSKGGGEE